MSRVSVYMSSFNHAQHVGEAIQSVLDQSFRDYELFILDDASTDGSWSVIQGFTDPRIHAFRNETNRNDKEGMRKVVSELASGEYIAVHHSDNAWEPDKLQKQVDFLDTHPGVGAVFTNAKIIREDGTPLRDRSHVYYKIFDQPNRTRYEWLNFFFRQGNALCHPSVLIRKRCYHDCGFYRAGLAFADFDMWVRLCMKYEIHVLPEKLVRFRVRSDESHSSGNRPDNRVRGQFEYLQVLDNYLKIPSCEELARVFPEVAAYVGPDGCDIGFVLGMLALQLRGDMPAFQLFGLRQAFGALNDPARAGKIKGLYGFGPKQLMQLTGKYDVFSVKFNTRLGFGAQVARPFGQLWDLWFGRDGLAHRALRKLQRLLRSRSQTIEQDRKLKEDLALIRSSGLFDPAWYLARNPDVARAGVDPAYHYLKFGGTEGREPGPGFSGLLYLITHEEARNAKINPLLHYLKSRTEAGRPIPRPPG